MSIIGRFTSNVPRVIGRAWSGGVDREMWNWMRKIHDSMSILTSQLIEIFGTPGGALQGLLTTKGDLLGFDTQPARVPVGDDLAVLASDSTTALGLAYHSQLARLMQKCTSSWRMEEGTGEVAIDSIGTSDLAPINSPVSAAGKIGKALTFLEADDRSLEGIYAALDVDTNNFSVSLWLKLTAIPTNGAIIVAKGDALPPGNGFGWEVGVVDTLPLLYVTLATAAGFHHWTGSVVLELDRFYHLCVTFDRAGLVSVYLDQVLDTTGSRDLNNPLPTADSASDPLMPFVIGANRYAFSLPNAISGVIDAVHFFNGYLLTAADVALLYSAGQGLELQPLWKPRYEDIPLAQKVTSSWRMEEATGEILIDSVGRNDLTPVSGPTSVAGKVGRALQFLVASNQLAYIADGQQSGLNPDHEDFSISFWVYPLTTNPFIIIDKGITDTGGIRAVGYSVSMRISVGIYGSGLHADFGAYDVTETTPDLGLFCQYVGTPPLNTWSHVVATFDRDGVCAMYLNGVRTPPQPAFVAINGDSMNREADTTGQCQPAAAFVVGGYSDNITPLPPVPQADARVDALHFFKGWVLNQADVDYLWAAGRGWESWNPWRQRRSFGITIDGGGGVLTTGQKGYVQIPFSGRIVSWGLVADQPGSVTIDVWRDSFTNSPPTVADSIVGAEKPTLTAQQQNQDRQLTSWLTKVDAGDVVGFNVDSVATIKRVTLTVWVEV